MTCAQKEPQAQEMKSGAADGACGCGRTLPLSAAGSAESQCSTCASPQVAAVRARVDQWRQVASADSITSIVPSAAIDAEIKSSALMKLTRAAAVSDDKEVLAHDPNDPALEHGAAAVDDEDHEPHESVESRAVAASASASSIVPAPASASAATAVPAATAPKPKSRKSLANTVKSKQANQTAARSKSLYD